MKANQNLKFAALQPVHFFAKLLLLTVTGYFVSMGTSRAEGRGSSELILRYAETSKEIKDLLRWNGEPIETLKFKTQQSFDPQTQEKFKTHGVVLSEFVNVVLQKLPLEARAVVDLVVVIDQQNRKVEIPRSFINRHPLFLAKKQTTATKWFLFLPAAEEKVKQEVLPVERYRVDGVQQVLLTSYSRYYSKRFFSKQQTDPALARGEKRFVQTCLACHALDAEGMDPGKKLLPTNLSQFQMAGHPAVRAMPAFNLLDQRAVEKFARANSDPIKFAKNASD